MDCNLVIYPVILSGGTGSRLWPLSREQSPKQFISLIDDKNLLQNTCLRFAGLKEFTDPIIICNQDHRFQAAESLRNINMKPMSIILEPIARNTAPAIALAAFSILEMDMDGVMLVLPADHYLKDSTEMINSVITAAESCHIHDYLFTFAIKPQKAETGYGYIEIGEMLGGGIRKVAKFIEKPNVDAAKKYLDSGKYYWNSGIFLFSAKLYLKELKESHLEIYQTCQKAYFLRKQDLDFVRVDPEAFESCPSESIDYAILEKTKNILVILLGKSTWSDIGSWGALFDLGKKDESGNILKGDILCSSVSNCYLQSHDRLLAAVGIKDIIVVETADAILVVHRNKTQKVKHIVKKLQCNTRDEVLRHKKSYSPWGYSEELHKGNGFIVKFLHFIESGRTSLHKHYNRSEYFSVLLGEAEIVLGKERIRLKAGESISVNPEIEHQIINVGEMSLSMLEVRLGIVLDELDIVRT